MSLSRSQLKDVCLYYDTNAHTCRYLAEDDQDMSKVYCLKLNTIKKNEIDAKVKGHIKRCKDKGVDPYALNDPIGNNCAGFPILKHITQGYDCP